MDGRKTLAELYNNLTGVPCEHGVYQIVLPKGMTIAFSEKIAGHPDDAYAVAELEQRYAKLKFSAVLYIGKAGGRRGLNQRLRQYMHYGFSGGRNHRGGRSIFQIKGFEQLVCEWKCIPNCEAEERRMLQAFKQQYGDYPLANHRG